MPVVDRKHNVAVRGQIRRERRVVAGRAALPGASVDLHDGRVPPGGRRPVDIERQRDTAGGGEKDAARHAHRAAVVKAQNEIANRER